MVLQAASTARDKKGLAGKRGQPEHDDAAMHKRSRTADRRPTQPALAEVPHRGSLADVEELSEDERLAAEVMAMMSEPGLATRGSLPTASDGHQACSSTLQHLHAMIC